MKKVCICLLFSFNFLFTYSQSFTGSGGPIPDGGSLTCFPVSVSGVGNINGTYGLASVCINILHEWDADLEIKLKAPDGTIIDLSLQNGGGGDNYTNTCFSSDAISILADSSAPFTGNFIPEGNLGLVNNGQNADDTWYLCVRDLYSGDSGEVVNFSLTFNNSPAPPPPNCLGNAVAGNTCASAPQICNFSGYCGNTSNSYTADSWPELTAAFCGTIENNSFLTFVASDDTALFKVWVFNSFFGDGIQVMIYSGGCGSGPVTTTAGSCYGPLGPSSIPHNISVTGLTPGNTYYIMIDGYGQDVCDYVLLPVSGVVVRTATINYPDSIACSSSGTPLQASITGVTGGIFSGDPTGLNIDLFTGEIIPSASIPGTYIVTYSVDGTGGICPTLVSNATIKIVTPGQIEWIGAVSTAWENPANWSCGNIPVSGSDVVLNQGNIVINSNVKINSLALGPNVNLTVAAGYNLTILQ